MTPRKKRNQIFPTTLKEWQDATVDFLFDVLVIFLVVFLVVRPFIVAPFQVKQQSMEPNVHDSEYILVAKLPYNRYLGWDEYERGDIVVFQPQTNPEIYLIKRVIGLPGETVKIEGGHVWVQQADESWEQQPDAYLAARNQGNTCWQSGGSSCTDAAKNDALIVTVPEDSYFVLGDNRLASRDSRSCFLGRCDTDADRFVTHDDIEGTALFVFFPVTQVRALVE